jgi:hypothetical protein
MKSGFIGRIAAKLVPLQAQPPHLENPLGWRQLEPVGEVVLVGLGVRGIPPDGDV